MTTTTANTTPAALDPVTGPEPGPGTRTDVPLCPIRVGDQVSAAHDPAWCGRVTYVSDYNHDGLIECLVESSDGRRGFAPPWMLRLVDGDQDTFAAQMAALVAAQKVTAVRVLRDKQQRALTAAREAAQTLATLIDDLEHDRIPFEVGGGCDIDELDEMLREASEFREVAIAVELLDPPGPAHHSGPDIEPAPVEGEINTMSLETTLATLYQREIDILRADGLDAEVTGTGGGCMAIAARLASGYSMLATNSWDGSLAAEGEDRNQWSIGIYLNGEQTADAEDWDFATAYRNVLDFQ